jgi:two-component system NtrC family sensor kinase
MKTITIIVLLLLSSIETVMAQAGNDVVSFRQVPVALHLQIGFLFIYILLGLLFLMLFIFYPRQRLNIYFSLYNISLALLIINQQIIQSNANHTIASGAIGFISRMIGMNILLFILYALDRIKPVYWLFVGFTLCIDFPLSLILKEKYFLVETFVHASFTVICFFQAIAAFKNKSAGSWLIGLVALAVVLVNIYSILSLLGKEGIVPVPVLGITPFVNTISGVIYLALRYARTNTSLEQQLMQVQRLSAENLQREQERQQLLATQNETLERQVTVRTLELSKSLDDLRAAQTQLIQSEKMASLGELTAGIAHEIQNPLNFVNNFSDVNKELLTDVKEEMQNENYDEAKKIIDDVISNEGKINHHGKRADAIVKGMLQHSRSGTGQKEPADINALANEYLRLSYQGLRAKDNSFSATMKTDFDNAIGKINIVPQDIGRVLLNLYNNAFYAVNEKQNTERLNQNAEFQPVVSVTTKKMNDKVILTVMDNGNGIPQKIADKIFQPFFTTKPTGQGTGLGLSLSYDIVKAHGGEIKAENRAEGGTDFIIELPFKI